MDNTKPRGSTIHPCPECNGSGRVVLREHSGEEAIAFRRRRRREVPLREQVLLKVNIGALMAFLTTTRIRIGGLEERVSNLQEENKRLREK